MSSKKTTTSSSQQQATSTPTVPSWIANPTQNVVNNVNSIAANGPTAYMPTVSPLQQTSWNDISSYNPTSNYDAATSAYGAVNPITTDPNSFANATQAYSNVPNVQAQSLLTNLSDYYNPYESSVINPALAALTNQQQQQSAQQQAAAAAGQAFQGSRYGVEQGVTAGQNTLATGQLVSGYLNDMYNTATQLSAQDVANQLTASQANQNAALAKASGLTGIDTTQANLSLQAQQATAQNQLAKASGLAGIGSNLTQAQLQQLALTNTAGTQATTLQQQQQQYPLTFQSQIEGLLSGINPQLYTGQTSSGTASGKSTEVSSDPLGEVSGLLSSLGKAAGGAASIASII